ncbi:hypothetical protein SV7mr_24100 [Stieleria bergensis]|uniref:Uncharacterized protein n=1 Tax=Stieleria bergensis TaxID=2528025 RepID=A0A517SUT5_9BACT|nr:hypothetical protein SV7mr_24100 [Planctomycetes bacterium SV_7m_r]
MNHEGLEEREGGSCERLSPFERVAIRPQLAGFDYFLVFLAALAVRCRDAIIVNRRLAMKAIV